jgi:hypothetical protein
MTNSRAPSLAADEKSKILESVGLKDFGSPEVVDGLKRLAQVVEWYRFLKSRPNSAIPPHELIKSLNSLALKCDRIIKQIAAAFRSSAALPVSVGRV